LRKSLFDLIGTDENPIDAQGRPDDNATGVIPE
jgi:hypothetical protein